MMEEFIQIREIRLGKVGAIGPYILAIMPKLTNSELATFPRGNGVRAESITVHDDGSQSFVFRSRDWYFIPDKNAAFLELADDVAAHFGVESLNNKLVPIAHERTSLFNDQK